MIKLDTHTIAAGEKPLVIAEAGTNFGGDIDLAKSFTEEAAAAGADVIKFQTHLRDAEMAEDGMREIGFGDLYDRMIHQELSVAEHRELMAHCEAHDITFLSTPFSVEGVKRLDDLDIPAIKIGSGELTNYHLLRTAAETGRPLLVSTGMADMETVRDAVAFLDEHAAEYALLYCVSSYPTDPDDFNFDLLDQMRTEFDVPVGFSDHSTGVEAAKLAMGRGAKFVEKHFTLTRQLPWGDQEVSIEPDELAELSRFATLCCEADGSTKELLPVEADIKRWANHSVVAVTRLEPGTELTEANVTTKRPGTGIPASRFYDVLGSEVARPITPDSVLAEADLKQPPDDA